MFLDSIPVPSHQQARNPEHINITIRRNLYNNLHCDKIWLTQSLQPKLLPPRRSLPTVWQCSCREGRRLDRQSVDDTCCHLCTAARLLPAPGVVGRRHYDCLDIVARRVSTLGTVGKLLLRYNLVDLCNGTTATISNSAASPEDT